MERGYARAEERNRAAREALEPLSEGERPAVVSVGAVVSALIALVFWVSAGLAAFTDAEVSGDRPNPVPLFAIAVILSAMAHGMWRARYWAVLGFQTVLLLFMLSAAAGLVAAGSLLQAVGSALLLIFAGVLFYVMIKAMARIQMPRRLPRE